MKRIERVMVCVDFSEYSKVTVEYALALTRGLNTEILLLNVINRRNIDALQTVTPLLPNPISIEHYKERMLAKYRTRLHEWIEGFSSSDAMRAKPLVTIGIPSEAILQTITAEKIDLVVTGPKGRSNLAGMRFGSNAEKVFRHSPVPVLNVRNRARFGHKPIMADQHSTDQALAQIRRIVAAIDFSAYSYSVMEYAAELAASNSAVLVVVNVINFSNRQLAESVEKAVNEQCPDIFSWEKFLYGEMEKRDLNLGEMINKAVPKDVPARAVVRKGIPFEEILRVVDDEQADLLVMNSKGRTNLSEYLFGTTAEKLFRHSPAPVLSLNLKIRH